MARRKGGGRKGQDAEAFAALIVVVLGLAGVILFIPLLVIPFVYFSKLKNRYLQSPSVQRVIDIRRMLSYAGGAGITACVLIGASVMFMLYFIDGYTKGIIVSPVEIIILCCLNLLSFLFAFFIAVFVGLHIAILYLGIIGDKENDILFFPPDRQSYTLGDYFGTRYIKDTYSIDYVNLSEINKITRGYGVDLYVHGAFGSRKITMSTKQKRDECLAMIQAFTGKKGLVFSEMERY